jgi:hypothetical protein
MSSIFISYRREDAEGQAGRLYDDLVAEFGSDSVFMDVAAIQFGRDFRKAIDQSLGSCGAFLSLIGKNWVNATDASGQRRLDDPSDFVRLETAAALHRDIPVIPVLVQSASTPKPDQLPDDLKELAFRNSIELTHARWDADVQLLIKALRRYTSKASPPVEQKRPRPSKQIDAKTVALIVVILAALVGVAVYLWPAPHKSGEKLADSGSETDVKRAPAKKTAVSESKLPLGEATNAPAASISNPREVILRALKFSAESKPMENQAKRYYFTLSVKLPPQTLTYISRVHYDLILESNPLSLEGGPPPDFSAFYNGWGCYSDVAVIVYMTGSEAPVRKTFNMCTALGW